MIGKSRKALITLGEDIKTKRVEKIYLAVCVGSPKEMSGQVTAKIFRKEIAQRENKMIIDEKNGQTALTKYMVLEANIEEKYSLIAAKIETGRMHQIRLHMNHIGAPVLGDNTYGDRRANREAEQKNRISRQFLHAYLLRFKHPVTGKGITIVAPPYADMSDFLASHQVILDSSAVLLGLTGRS